jgi:hypothetical protein
VSTEERLRLGNLEDVTTPEDDLSLEEGIAVLPNGSVAKD